MKIHITLFFLLFSSFSFLAIAWGAPSDRAVKVVDSPGLDYQPAIITMAPSGHLMMVFERIDMPDFEGDLSVTFSSDQGYTWSPPLSIIHSPFSELHPALVQLGDGSFALFFLIYYPGSTNYRIGRATSPDGVSWVYQGGIDLGWTTPGEANPCVIREGDGTLTMTYQRVSGASYIAQSKDSGVTWDKLKTQVSDSNGALPRLAKRAWDGRYVLTYQTGSIPCHMWCKTTLDPYNWPSPHTPFSATTNSHDSQPMLIEGGTFLVTYAEATTGAFDMCYKTSYDGVNWSSRVKVTSDDTRYDTQPHPVRSGAPGHVIVAWSHQESGSAYVDHDVWVEPKLEVDLPLWPDCDLLSAGTGGVVNLALDAGPSSGNRDYFILGSLSGTEPGLPLPGGMVTLPLQWDFFTDMVISLANSAALPGFKGALDGAGKSTAQINTLGSLPPSAVGATLYFAYLLYYPGVYFPYDYVSNPMGIVITP